MNFISDMEMIPRRFFSSNVIPKSQVVFEKKERHSNSLHRIPHFALFDLHRFRVNTLTLIFLVRCAVIYFQPFTLKCFLESPMNVETQKAETREQCRRTYRVSLFHRTAVPLHNPNEWSEVSDGRLDVYSK